MYLICYFKKSIWFHLLIPVILIESFTLPIWQIRNPKFREMKCVSHSMLTAAADNTQILGAQHSKGPQPFWVTVPCGQWAWGQEHRRLCSLSQGSKLFPLQIYICKEQREQRPTDGFRGHSDKHHSHSTGWNSVTQPHLSAHETEPHR